MWRPKQIIPIQVLIPDGGLSTAPRIKVPVRHRVTAVSASPRGNACPSAYIMIRQRTIDSNNQHSNEFVHGYASATANHARSVSKQGPFASYWDIDSFVEFHCRQHSGASVNFEFVAVIEEWIQ